ncbi:MAG: hypothetical protein LBS01_11350 [Prevotellaceae bacterium]|jgi:hypothetical protein|nr:hypothetical protein [Prevotellaceae bacterium]
MLKKIIFISMFLVFSVMTSYISASDYDKSPPGHATYLSFDLVVSHVDMDVNTDNFMSASPVSYCNLMCDVGDVASQISVPLPAMTRLFNNCVSNLPCKINNVFSEQGVHRLCRRLSSYS